LYDVMNNDNIDRLAQEHNRIERKGM